MDGISGLARWDEEELGVRSGPVMMLKESSKNEFAVADVDAVDVGGGAESEKMCLYR